MVDIDCEKCGYQWDYSGELWNTTCPRCNLKTKTPYNYRYKDYKDTDKYPLDPAEH